MASVNFSTGGVESITNDLASGWETFGRIDLTLCSEFFDLIFLLGFLVDAAFELPLIFFEFC